MADDNIRCCLRLGSKGCEYKGHKSCSLLEASCLSGNFTGPSSRRCPKCHGVNGYVERVVMSGSDHFDFSGEKVGLGDIKYVQGGKRKYCADCNKDITKFVKGLAEKAKVKDGKKD